MNNNEAQSAISCFNCGKKNLQVSDRHYWYHGDQDDQVCTECARILRHTDTAYAGMTVESTSIKIGVPPEVEDIKVLE